MTTTQSPALIAGRYALDLVLADGQGCQVWRGTDTTLARPIVIKVVAVDQILTYRAALAETARLGHPAFVTIYDSLDHEDQLAIIQEAIDGDSFADLVADNLAPVVVARIGYEIALALAHAHRLGVVHGDLTTATVLRDQWGAIRINDVALPPDSAYFAAAANILAGGDWTVFAPDFRDDLRALGVLLWLLATRHAEPPAEPAGWEGAADVVPPPLRECIERLISATHPAVITNAEEALSTLRQVIRQLTPAPSPIAKIPPWELPRSTLDLAPSRPKRQPPVRPVEQATHTPVEEPRPFIPPVSVGPVSHRASNDESTWANSRIARHVPHTSASDRSRRALDLFLWTMILIGLYLFWLAVGYVVPGWFGH